MLKFLLFFIVFILFLAGTLVYKVIKTALQAGKAAYDSISNSHSFEEAYKNFADNLSNSRAARGPRMGNSQLKLLEEVVALMAKVAASDGRVSRAEVEYMSDTIVSMTDSMQAAGVANIVVESIKKRLFAIANSAKRDDKPLSHYTQVLAHTDPELRKRVMLQLISCASIDGLTETKRQLLFQIGANLQFTANLVESFINQVFGSSSEQSQTTHLNPYEVLGCKETDSFDDIKLAYRRLVKQYHPDYMHGQGADDEAVKQATQKIQEINAAYEKVKKMRG